MSASSDPEHAQLQFHWDKWKAESNRFWRHVSFATIGLLFISLYQLGVLQFESDSIKMISSDVGADVIKKWLLAPISFWLWLSILAGLLDLLRHRVPEKYEVLVHENTCPIPGLKREVNIRGAVRILYLLVMVGYITILGGWVVYCAIRVWSS